MPSSEHQATAVSSAHSAAPRAPKLAPRTGQLAALREALDLKAQPDKIVAMRHGSLPEGMGDLLACVSTEPEPCESYARTLGVEAATLRDAARQYVDTVLMTPDASLYRALGVTAAASGSLIRAHYRSLMLWLRPHLPERNRLAEMARRATDACTVLNVEQQRIRYDRELAFRAFGTLRPKTEDERGAVAEVPTLKPAEDLETHSGKWAAIAAAAAAEPDTDPSLQATWEPVTLAEALSAQSPHRVVVSDPDPESEVTWQPVTLAELLAVESPDAATVPPPETLAPTALASEGRLESGEASMPRESAAQDIEEATPADEARIAPAAVTRERRPRRVRVGLAAAVALLLAAAAFMHWQRGAPVPAHTVARTEPSAAPAPAAVPAQAPVPVTERSAESTGPNQPDAPHAAAARVAETPRVPPKLSAAAARAAAKSAKSSERSLARSMARSPAPAASVQRAARTAEPVPKVATAKSPERIASPPPAPARSAEPAATLAGVPPQAVEPEARALLDRFARAVSGGDLAAALEYVGADGSVAPATLARAGTNLMKWQQAQGDAAHVSVQDAQVQGSAPDAQPSVKGVLAGGGAGRLRVDLQKHGSTWTIANVAAE